MKNVTIEGRDVEDVKQTRSREGGIESKGLGEVDVAIRAFAGAASERAADFAGGSAGLAGSRAPTVAVAEGGVARTNPAGIAGEADVVVGDGHGGAVG